MAKPHFGIPYLVIQENHNPVNVTDAALSKDWGLAMKTFWLRSHFAEWQWNIHLTSWQKQCIYLNVRRPLFTISIFFGKHLHITGITLWKITRQLPLFRRSTRGKSFILFR